MKCFDIRIILAHHDLMAVILTTTFFFCNEEIEVQVADETHRDHPVGRLKKEARSYGL